MSELNKKYEDLMESLNNTIKNEEELKSIKGQISYICATLLDEIDSLKEISEDKIQALLQNQKMIVDRMEKLEEATDKIEKELYIEDDNFDFEIVCPYCNYNFIVDIDETKTEIECPECNNIIELDWNGGDEECSGHCSGCHGCESEDEEDLDDM